MVFYNNSLSNRVFNRQLLSECVNHLSHWSVFVLANQTVYIFPVKCFQNKLNNAIVIEQEEEREILREKDAKTKIIFSYICTITSSSVAFTCMHADLRCYLIVVVLMKRKFYSR